MFKDTSLSYKKANYSGAEVWQAYLKNKKDVDILLEMECDEDLQIWNVSPYTAEFLIKRDKLCKVRENLKVYGINYTVHIDDVEQRLCNMFTNKKGPIVAKGSGIPLGEDEHYIPKIDWAQFPSWEVVKGYLIHLAQKYADIVELTSIGKTSEGRPILMYKISNKHPENKKIMIISGVRSNEWMAIVSTLYMLVHITTHIKDLPVAIQNKDWYIIPILNPDGYEYSHFVDRFWKKNRRTCKGEVGIDLALNFAKFWDQGKDPKDCAANFRGVHAFSEPETKALKKFMRDDCKAKPFHAFLDIQSYGQLIAFPWSAIEKKTNDSYLHGRVAQVMRQLIYNNTNHIYHFTTGYDSPHPRFGVSIDWAYSFNIIFSYIIKLRDTGELGHFLQGRHVEDNGAELFFAVKYLAEVLDLTVFEKT